MLPSAYDLKEYYSTPQGQGVLQLLLRRFGLWWPESKIKSDIMLGVGYALPYLDTCRGPKQLYALLAGQMGAMAWPAGGTRRCVLSDRGVWPIPGASLDYVLMIHELEYAEDPGAVLDEVWRALKPEGRLMLVVPNRTGLWARAESTPFGHGRPFTSKQLHTLLRDRNFSLERMTGALFAPPFKSPALNRHVAPILEKMAPVFAPLSGVIVVEASKRLYSPIHGKPVAAPAKPAIIWSTVPQGN